MREQAGAAWLVLAPVPGTLVLEPGEAILLGSHEEDMVGYAVATGAVDGVGGHDLVVGAPFADDGGKNGGAGSSVAAGDLDGDGVDDVLLDGDGASDVVATWWWEGENYSDAAETHIFYGGTP